LIGIVPRNVTKDIHDIGYNDVADQVRRTAALEASRVNWFSTYHVHHRVAGEFRKGRAFLLGDAGHIHSPAGGQGMNTGIGDASNLAWKLATVLQRRAAATLLESYPAERIAIAYRIVRSTDRIFSFQVSPSWAMRMARRWLTPLIPALMRTGAVRRFMFRAISQIAFAYRESPISAGRTGRARSAPGQPDACGEGIVCPGSGWGTAQTITKAWAISSGKYTSILRPRRASRRAVRNVVCGFASFRGAGPRALPAWSSTRFIWCARTAMWDSQLPKRTSLHWRIISRVWMFVPEQGPDQAHER
jgi:hypothetical protein